jgi:crotonobetainyl-CoA:carnitine CoA-transferase CaiB-like acyl-CoA transferase
MQWLLYNRAARPACLAQKRWPRPKSLDWHARKTAVEEAVMVIRPEAPTPERPLSGVRVAEFGAGSAVAYCGKLFADFGAAVVKVEAPGGDPGRRMPPLIDRGDGVGESGVFAWLNTNKQSVTVASDDKARLAEIVGANDVLLDARPGAGADAGATGHAALRAAFPGLTIVAFSWFGESGPYRDFAASDSVVRALAGLVKATGSVDQPALQAEHQSGVPAALSGFTAAVGALLGGGKRGRRFEISIHEANVALADFQTATAVQLEIDERRTGVNRWYPTFPVGIYPCREGWLGITALTPDQWRGFCDLFGMDAQAIDPNYTASADRLARADELETVFVPLLQARTAREWFEEGMRRRLPFTITPDMAELLGEPVHRGRGAFGQVRIGEATFEAPVLPQHLSRTPPSASGAAPLAGADTDSWRPAPSVLRRDGEAALPLAGVRIVDLAMGWAGPLATRQMADLGAEIIKVEGRAYPDWWRGSEYSEASIAEHAHEMSLNFNILNRNKTGITLDLTRPGGADLLRRLVATADAVVENYSQGVLPKLGLGYADLCAVNPDIVMVSMPAFGSDTAWADVRAYGSTLEQASGLPSVTGRADWPPTMNHIAFGDPIGGLNSAAALVVALMHRQRTGQGQHVDLSQVECMFPQVAPWIIEQSIKGRVGPRVGNRHPLFAPHGCFRCEGEDEWLVIAVTDDTAWQALCAVIGRADLAQDPALAKTAGRRAAEDRLEAVIGAWTRARAPDAAMQALQARGVAAGVARGFRELVVAEPHLQARGYWQAVDRPHLGLHRQPSPTFREEGRAYPIRTLAPTLGQSTRDVLSGVLGLSASELDALEADRIIGTEPIPVGQRPPRSATLLHAAARGETV